MKTTGDQAATARGHPRRVIRVNALPVIMMEPIKMTADSITMPAPENKDVVPSVPPGPVAFVSCLFLNICDRIQLIAFRFKILGGLPYIISLLLLTAGMTS